MALLHRPAELGVRASDDQGLRGELSLMIGGSAYSIPVEGRASVDTTITHEHSQLGTAGVTASVSDAAGNTTEEQCTVDVIGDGEPRTTLEVVAPSEVASGEPVTLYVKVEDDYLEAARLELGDGTAVELAVSGNVAEDTVTHTYGEVGFTEPELVLTDETGEHRVGLAVPLAVNANFRVEVFEMTDHRIRLEGGVLTVVRPQGDTITAEGSGSSYTFLSVPGEVEILYEDGTHTNPRQATRKAPTDKPYGERVGGNWERHDRVVLMLEEGVDYEHFAMRDDWESPRDLTGAELYRHTKAGVAHTHLCENVDPDGLSDGELEITFVLDDEFRDPIPQANKDTIRHWMAHTLPEQVSTNVRYTLRGVEADVAPSDRVYHRTIAEDTQNAPGNHSESHDDDGCMSSMNYIAPGAGRTTLELPDVTSEILQNFFFHQDHEISAFFLLSDDGSPSVFAREAVAVNETYGPRTDLWEW